MKLKYVSITGADDEVNIEDLNAISDQYPFVEWAILLLPEQEGSSRFPTIDWIKNFTKKYKGAHKAMHLCGDVFLGFVENDPGVLALMQGFNRVQLNLEFGDVEGKYDLSALFAQIKAHPEFEFIIQYTDKNNGLLSLLHDIPNHAVLFDESAGTGLSPKFWPAPLEGHFCGYAGGINPDNVAQNIDMIAQAAGDYETWIDMESGVRTDDRFDLEKVRQVLKITAAER